ncbi:DUF2267 domain-containing protein [Nesterenkonia marinintestina]|uniref:DUF2267 domain-containing protein n=1 Tax=Nesterenkonia marinintestina TaxID=2979865 RepID=UPI0021BE150A|nr:DUF2267 domain-containing protein [Nesterenkonia sp. GX14115]
MRTDEFIASVSELGGPTDRQEAEKVTHVVLEDLGKRLKGGEPGDLAAQLPEELKATLTAHDGKQPVDDDVDTFLRRVADHSGQDVDPDQARRNVQAVLSTIARSISDGEVQALRSQLPAGFGPLFEASA